MTRRAKIVAVILGSLALVYTGITSAQTIHLFRSMNHAGQAIAHGQHKHSEHIVAHAKPTLKHAKMAKEAEEENLQHIEKAITHIQRAIEEGERDKPEMATKHMEKGIMHLERVTHLEEEE